MEDAATSVVEVEVETPATCVCPVERDEPAMLVRMLK